MKEFYILRPKESDGCISNVYTFRREPKKKKNGEYSTQYFSWIFCHAIFCAVTGFHVKPDILYKMKLNPEIV